MKNRFRVALAQDNVTVGDFDANCRKIASGISAARKTGSDLVAFPELAVCGYPPEDLLFKRSFIDANLAAVKRLAPLTRGLTAIVGFVDRDAQGSLYNAAAVLSSGRWLGSYRKIELPNYGVFDEKRYFKKGRMGLLLQTGGGHRIGLSICEDIWLAESFVYKKPYRGSTSLILNISASPYHVGKLKERRALVSSLARATGAHVAYLNLVGGQDELVFDGGSLIASPDGRILAQGNYLEEDLLVADLELRSFTDGISASLSEPHETLAVDAVPGKVRGSTIRRKPAVKYAEEEELYRALMLGTRDYIRKNGFKKVLIGLSGGIDSALVAQIAVDALGPAAVIGVTMPSRFTSKGTLADARRLARNLKIKLLEMSIEKAFGAYRETLAPSFAGQKENCAEENLQARIRGNLLMALSNKYGHLVLTTGNKSEMATGYCTLYGDMAGGFAVLKDVPKTAVYRLARWRNRKAGRALIPEATLRRAPTAELRHGQKDQDTLPPYPQLDAILKLYIEEDRSVDEIVGRGHPRPVVRKVAALVDRNEYKRRQAPPGVKITPKAFGRDRRMPISGFSAR